MKENKFSFVSLRNEIFTFGSCKFGNDLGHYLTSRCVTISYGLDKVYLTLYTSTTHFCLC